MEEYDYHNHEVEHGILAMGEVTASTVSCWGSTSLDIVFENNYGDKFLLSVGLDLESLDVTFKKLET